MIEYTRLIFNVKKIISPVEYELQKIFLSVAKKNNFFCLNFLVVRVLYSPGGSVHKGSYLKKRGVLYEKGQCVQVSGVRSGVDRVEWVQLRTGRVLLRQGNGSYTGANRRFCSGKACSVSFSRSAKRTVESHGGAEYGSPHDRAASH
jgi:hypothetical protein